MPGMISMPSHLSHQAAIVKTLVKRLNKNPIRKARYMSGKLALVSITNIRTSTRSTDGI